MAQNSLHFRKLRAVGEHAFRQTVAQHMRRNHIKLLSKCPQAFGPLQIPFSLRRLTHLSGCLPTQIRDALPNHTCFDPWNERTRSSGDVHADEQMFALLLAPDGWETCGAAHFMQVALQETLCVGVQRQAASLSSFATA